MHTEPPLNACCLPPQLCVVLLSLSKHDLLRRVSCRCNLTCPSVLWVSGVCVFPLVLLVLYHLFLVCVCTVLFLFGGRL